MNDAAPIACSLNADDYRTRLATIREIGANALLTAEERPDGARLSFRNADGVHDRLVAVVRAESECCPFLVLEVSERQGRLDLAVMAPPEALPVVRDLVRSFRGEAVA